jgi:hypothetical protein
MGIKHIEDITESQLELLKTNWNQNLAVVTEKVDGCHMMFGIENDKFFLGSKNIIFRNYIQIPDVYFYDDFRNYFKQLCQIPFKIIFESLCKKHGVQVPIKLEGEAIPRANFNIVKYNKFEIGSGVFVLFKTLTDNEDFWNDLVGELNKYTTIKFCVLPNLQYDFKIENGNGLAVKEAILNNFKFIPMFGTEFEGLIIKLSDGSMVKAVDKKKFNEVKNINWKYINSAIRLKTQFKNKTKKDINNIQKNLKDWLEDLNALENEFNTTGFKTLTLKNKVKDTSEYISFCKLQIIKPLLQKLRDGHSASDVFQAFLDKKYSDEKPVQKQGHTALFKQTNSCIPNHLIECNVNQLFTALSFDFDYSVVGNSKKSFLGDLDVAISKTDLIDKLQSEDIWNALDGFLKANGFEYSICKGLKQFHVLKPLQDEFGNHLNAVNKNGESLCKPGYIQVDFFVGNTEWMKSILSGAPEDSAYKANYRNIFLRSIFEGINARYFNNLLTFTLDWKEGVKGYTESITEPIHGSKAYTRKRIKTEEHLIFDNQDRMTRFLFGPSVSWDDINSFEKLYGLYNSNQFKFHDWKTAIDQLLIINLYECKLEIPDFITVSSI